MKIPPEDFRAAGCSGKQRYESHSLAETVRKRGSRNKDRRRQVYRCCFCFGFHIGEPGRKKQHRPREHAADDEF